MSNSIALYPTIFAAAFDQVDAGQYTLPFDVSRSFESSLADFGQTVTVPVAPEFTAEAYTPGQSITVSGIAQTSVDLTLNKSYHKVIDLTDKEMSLSPYDLQQTYAIPMMEALLAQVNADIVTELATATTNSDVTYSGQVSVDSVISLKKALDGQKVGLSGRKLVMPTDMTNDLLSTTEFKSLTGLATPEMLSTGVLVQRYGFDIKMNHAMSDTGYAFHSSAIAFAARPYKLPEAGLGAYATTVSYKGIPIRIIAKYTDNLTYRIQAAVLYGVKLVKGSRVCKVTEA